MERMQADHPLQNEQIHKLEQAAIHSVYADRWCEREEPSHYGLHRRQPAWRRINTRVGAKAGRGKGQREQDTEHATEQC